MATNVLKFCRVGIANGVAFLVGASGVGCAAGRIYTRLGEDASSSGLFVAWAVDFGALLFLPFHYPPQSALGRFLHLAFYIAPPLWCQSDTVSGFSSFW